MTAVSNLAGFRALDPFFAIIKEGVAGLADGEHFFDLLAEDVVFEYVITVPGYPRRVEGRQAVAGLYRPYGATFSLDRCYDLAIHHDQVTGVVVLEYASQGRVVATWCAGRGRPAVTPGIAWLRASETLLTHAVTARRETQMVTETPGRNVNVAVLGIGIMGSAMARNLVSAGLRTTIWDRSSTATAPLADAGALVAASPAEAVRDAQVVVTMLPTADVVTSVIFDSGVAEALPGGAVWAQMGTIGLAETTGVSSRLGELRPDVMFVDAPVSGSKGPAEAGQLLILASGPPAAAPAVRPAFSAIGRRTVWLGEAGQGSRMKLAVNAYMSILIEGVAEALELAGQLGIDGSKLAEAIEGGPLDAPIADAKLHKMERGDFAPEFPLEWALKDVDLAISAAGGDELPLLAALSRQWHAAVDAGHGREDVSAARLALGPHQQP